MRVNDETAKFRSYFPWIGALESATPDITKEMTALLRENGEEIYAAGTGEMSTVYDSTKGWGTMRFRYMGRYVEVRSFRGISVTGSSSVGKVQTLGRTAVPTLARVGRMHDSSGIFF